MNTLKNKIKRNKSDYFFDFCLYFFLGVLAFLCVMPMWHVLMGALSDHLDVYINTDFLFVPMGKFDKEAWKYDRCKIFPRNSI